MGDQLKKIADDRDANAFRSLFLAFYPKVKAMLVRQGTDTHTAEEIAQDTLFLVWRKSHQFSVTKGSLSAWIYTIARNLRIDRLRKQAGWQRCYQELETMEQLREPAEAQRSPQWEEGEITQMLASLSPDQREVLQLAFIEGLSQSEIATRLGIPLGTVKSRMRLAFDKLRGQLERTS